MRAIPTQGIDADIHRLEVGLRRLKVQYDMFFAGALARQPFELRSEIEAIIRRHSIKPTGKYAQRFHFNALVARYNTLSELWGKTVRTMEEGEHRNPGFLDQFSIRERLVARCRVSNAAEDEPNLRRLHGRYVAASRRLGAKRQPSFDQFVRGVSAQTDRLRREAGCDQIELRLVVRDDKVHLKARPGK